MMRLSTEREPGGATPCFCASCMRLGGRARELLRRTWMRSTARLVALVPDGDGLTGAEKRARGRIARRQAP